MTDQEAREHPIKIIERTLDAVLDAVSTVSESIHKNIQSYMASLTNSRAGVIVHKMHYWRILLAFILVITAVAPALIIIGNGYAQYEELKQWGTDGAHQLLSIKDIISSATQPNGSTATGTASGSGITSTAKNVLTPDILKSVQKHLVAAQDDFRKVDTEIVQQQGILKFVMMTSYASKVESVQKMAEVALDATALGIELTNVGMDFTQTFQTSPFSPDGQPLLTPKSFSDVQQAIQDTYDGLQNIQAHLQGIHLQDLPLSVSQRALLEKYLPKIPHYIQQIQTLQPYVPLAGWALGVDHQRSYLIETMDRTELRSGGGFLGSWGILNITGGRMGQISMTDATFVDYYNNVAHYQSVPAQYSSWWPWPWKFMDSNASGDFPTTAKLELQSFQGYAKANGLTVGDGVINFSPLVIEHILDPSVLGSITLPCYNVTITSTNLESELHYFQNPDTNSPGYQLQNKCSSSLNGTTSLRKRFTSALASQLEAQMRSTSTQTLLKIVNSMRQDLLTKDLEIYVSNQQVEDLLIKDHLNAAMIRGNSQDSTYIVQESFSVNKYSLDTHETTTETITLDKFGGAYHDLRIHFNYQPSGNVYGLPTYRDYIRVYAPPGAEYIDGGGFDLVNQPPVCYLAKPKPDGSLPPPVKDPQTGQMIPYADESHPCMPTEPPFCANGSFQPGTADVVISRMLGSDNTHIDQVGDPTNMKSDEPGRSMFGGLVVVPSYCQATVRVVWYIPHVGGTLQQHNLPYSFTIQRQSGAMMSYQVSILPAYDSGTKGIQSSAAILSQDLTWSLK